MTPWPPRVSGERGAELLADLGPVRSEVDPGGGLVGDALHVDVVRLEPVEYVDLERFMGDWYVIANIPTFIEKGAHNAIESYRLTDDGEIATTFRFRDGAFDGPLKVYRPTGFVSDDNNAIWGMQFLWPIKAEFTTTIHSRPLPVSVIRHVVFGAGWPLR